MQIIAVHGGAGFHSHSSASEVKRALRSACASAICDRTGGISALQAVSSAITVLEDEECLNAGYGSNLTLSGTAECDASIMDGPTGDFGAVGAVQGVRNPIRLAQEVLRYSRIQDSLTRIPPLLLVSAGASDFADMQGLDRRPADNLISPRARQEWTKWKGELDAAQAQVCVGVPRLPEAQLVSAHLGGLHDRQDTVGAVVWDEVGDLAAGVSSGGLLLKLPGRVGEVGLYGASIAHECSQAKRFSVGAGQAAIYGAGCWASRIVACSVSGAGEYITRMSLARTICDAVETAGDDEDTHDILRQILETDFRKLCSERGESSPQAGVLLLVKDQDAVGQLKRHYLAPTTAGSRR